MRDVSDMVWAEHQGSRPRWRCWSGPFGLGGFLCCCRVTMCLTDLDLTIGAYRARVCSPSQSTL